MREINTKRSFHPHLHVRLTPEENPHENLQNLCNYADVDLNAN